MNLTKEELEQRSRLKTILKIKDIDRQTFANDIGRKIGYIQQMLSGNRRVSEMAVIRLSKRYTDINPEWIMEGKGAMLKSDKVEDASQNNIQVSEPAINYEHADPLLQLRALLEYYKERIENLEKRVSLLEGRVPGKEDCSP